MPRYCEHPLERLDVCIRERSLNHTACQIHEVAAVLPPDLYDVDTMDAFDVCVRVCRTSSLSLSSDSTYHPDLNNRQKYCFVL